jgi:hypothetical protein
MFIERRATPRHPIVQNIDAVVFVDQVQINGHIADISEQGVRVVLNDDGMSRSRETLAEGVRVSLVIKSDNQAFECEVRRVGADDLGLFFVDTTPRARRVELMAQIAG